MTEATLESRRGDVLVRRTMVPAERGLVGLRQVFSGSGLRAIVSHGAWTAAAVRVKRGVMSFPLAAGDVEAPSRFVLLVPAGHVVPVRFAAAHVVTEGMASFDASLTGKPRIAVSSARATTFDRRGLADLLARPTLVTLDADADVPAFVAVARRALHEHLDAIAPVAHVARLTRVAPATLTRAFCRAYGVTPKAYCHRARLFAAVIAILSGRAIAHAALEAGFNDLSRFYRQFRLRLGSTPGAYAAIRKRQDSA